MRPTLDDIADWLGRGAHHPPPFNLDAAEAVVEEARMVREALYDGGYHVAIRKAGALTPPIVVIQPPPQ